MPALCKLCGGDLRARLEQVRDSYSGETFSVLACAQCGGGSTAPVPDDLSRYYPAAYYGNRHGLTARYCLQRRCQWLEQICGAGHGKKLLDAGCGDGSFLERARARGWVVTGTELRARARSDFEIRGSLEEAAELGPFDCVSLWHSLEHFAEPRRALELIHDLLRPEGALLIAVPNAGGAQARLFGRHWLHLDVPRHLHHFSRNTLAALMQKAGFATLHTWNQEFEYDLLGWVQSALNVVLPRPNLLFAMLTGKERPAPLWQQAASWAGGGLLAIAALPATWVSAALGAGGTLIVAGRRT